MKAHNLFPITRNSVSHQQHSLRPNVTFSEGLADGIVSRPTETASITYFVLTTCRGTLAGRLKINIYEYAYVAFIIARDQMYG